MHQLAAIRLVDGWFPIAMFALAAAGIAAVVLTRSRRGRLKPLLTQLVIGLAAGATGGLVAWLVSDVFVVFGVGLGWAVMLAAAAGIGLVGFLTAAAVQSAAPRRALAIAVIPLVLAATALRIDIIYGEYTTVGSLFGLSTYPQLGTNDVHPAATDVASWRRLARDGATPAAPERGVVRAVDIPAGRSGFRARQAVVYLPPAALSETPPRLPVMIMLAGQPGSPDRFFAASRIADVLDKYAAAHDGLAPIVVSPDQNGSSTSNSLCADTPVHGNAETYLTEDVTQWVTDTLPVERDARQWLIGGFSQGATCSTQLGPAHPDLYGHIFSADGELEPVDRSRQETIDRFFGSDVERYLAHTPTRIIADHAPSTQTLLAVAGAWDPRSQDNQRIIGRAARDAGMQVDTLVARDSGHDWHTVQAALPLLVERFGAQTGLGDEAAEVRTYPDLETSSLD